MLSFAGSECDFVCHAASNLRTVMFPGAVGDDIIVGIDSNAFEVGHAAEINAGN